MRHHERHRNLLDHYILYRPNMESGAAGYFQRTREGFTGTAQLSTRDTGVYFAYSKTLNKFMSFRRLILCS